VARVAHVERPTSDDGGAPSVPDRSLPHRPKKEIDDGALAPAHAVSDVAPSLSAPTSDGTVRVRRPGSLSVRWKNDDTDDSPASATSSLSPRQTSSELPRLLSGSRTQRNSERARKSPCLADERIGKPSTMDLDDGNAASKDTSGPEAVPTEEGAPVEATPQVNRGDFEVLELLGSGGFGEVKLVRCTLDQQLYAMKAVEKVAIHERRHIGDENAGERAQAERDIGVLARQWNCPFIVELFAAFQTQEKLYYVFEYCPGGDILELVRSQPGKRLFEHTTQFYTAEACLALEHLHEHGIIHRDVRVENMLLAADRHLKLADFGIAKAGLRANVRPSFPFGRDRMAIYYPPEFRRGDVYGKDLDCWQLGVAVLCMLTGRHPRVGDTLPGDFPAGTSEAASDFCRAVLQDEQDQRLGHPEGSSQLQGHDFFRGLCWLDLREKTAEPPLPCCCYDDSSDGVESSGGARKRPVRPTMDTDAGVDFLQLRDFTFTTPTFSTPTGPVYDEDCATVHTQPRGGTPTMSGTAREGHGDAPRRHSVA